MKYFVLGAFSSAIFVYGIALAYGATGSTNLAEIVVVPRPQRASPRTACCSAGMALLLVGFGFKVAAVPFHMWTPDVYQGAPTPGDGLHGGHRQGGRLRGAAPGLLLHRSDRSAPTGSRSLWVLAIITLVLGAVLGLVQRDVKRMLAYSSINHAGFILLGLQAATRRGRRGQRSTTCSSTPSSSSAASPSSRSSAAAATAGTTSTPTAGSARRQPLLALAFAILLLAQAGAPFTTGFFAKLYVVEAAVAAHSYALAVIAMVSAAVAAFFYLRVVFLMYGRAPARRGPVGRRPVTLPAVGAGAGADEGTDEAAAEAGEPLPGDGPAEGTVGIGPIEVPVTTGVAIFLTVAFTVVFGIWPSPVVDFIHAATLLV